MDHMDYWSATESEFDDIISVFESRGIELLHSIQDGEVRIYSHFDEVEDIIWAIGATSQDMAEPFFEVCNG